MTVLVVVIQSQDLREILKDDILSPPNTSTMIGRYSFIFFGPVLSPTEGERKSKRRGRWRMKEKKRKRQKEVREKCLFPRVMGENKSYEEKQIFGSKDSI